ncbi:hypothetical protein [Acetilactobacillus jinshanensis]|uniref:hypothetical protein n=1 Tax=Acetilactobacillus jinshanensis TaxID=1720083 RepID=UPI0013A680A9|nr:hypothetical protein [Acetilactobacillus jinshanensis]URL61789.1 hypothetical protein HGK75_07575 [uncultured bacterium]
MARIYHVPVNKDVIQWSLDHGEYLNSAAKKYNFDKWMHPKKRSDYPTFKQL